MTSPWQKHRDKMERQVNSFLKERLPFVHSGLRSLRLSAKKLLWAQEVSYRLKHHLPLTNRSHLPVLLSQLGLTGVGVEVGVLKGYFSELILMYSDLSVLHSIDPWREFSDGTYDDKHNSKQQEQENRYQFTKARLAPYGSRSKIHRMTSQDAAPKFENGSVDFVYIDANHSYEAVKQDIELWWPKVKIGGVIAGHDYLDGQFPEGNFGVKKAVDEFAAQTGQTLYVIPVLWPTWYLIRE